MEEDERRKIDLKQHALPPVSKKHLFRIITYVILLTVLSLFIYSVYNRNPKQKEVKNPSEVKEIKGVTLIDAP